MYHVKPITITVCTLATCGLVARQVQSTTTGEQSDYLKMAKKREANSKKVFGDWRYHAATLVKAIPGGGNQQLQLFYETPDDVEKVWSFYADKVPKTDSSGKMLNSQRAPWRAPGAVNISRGSVTESSSKYTLLTLPQSPRTHGLIISQQGKRSIFVDIWQNAPREGSSNKTHIQLVLLQTP
jgi:hypothetical protein